MSDFGEFNNDNDEEDFNKAFEKFADASEANSKAFRASLDFMNQSLRSFGSLVEDLIFKEMAEISRKMNKILEKLEEQK